MDVVITVRSMAYDEGNYTVAFEIDPNDGMTDEFSINVVVTDQESGPEQVIAKAYERLQQITSDLLQRTALPLSQT